MKAWLGLGTTTTWLGLGKDRVLGLVTQRQLKNRPRDSLKKPSGFMMLLFHHPSSSFYESQLIDM